MAKNKMALSTETGCAYYYDYLYKLNSKKNRNNQVRLLGPAPAGFLPLPPVFWAARLLRFGFSPFKPCMSSASPGSGALSFEIKSAQLPLVALLLRSTDVRQLAQDLAQRFGDTPDFFDNDPLLIDLSGVQEEDTIPDFAALLPLLREHRLQPVAIKGGSEEQHQAALAAGLVTAQEATWTRTQAAQPAQPTTQAAPAAPVAAAPTSALVVDKPLRSGQQVYARGRDLVVLAMVNPGAEVIADGHIHVYAPLRGKAIAGARGNAEARIFAQALEAELISIAGVYRTSDVPLPDNVRGKAAQVRLQSSAEGDKLLLEPIL